MKHLEKLKSWTQKAEWWLLEAGVGGGKGDGKLVFDGYAASVLQDRRNPGDWMVVMGTQHCECTQRY